MKVVKLHCLLFLIVTGASLQVGCNKSSGPTEGIQSFDKEGFLYVQMPLDHYYIYKDSATSRLDSVVVTQSMLEKRHKDAESNLGIFGNHPGVTYEKFQLTLTRYADSSDSMWFRAESGDVFGDYRSSAVQPVWLIEPNGITVFYYEASVAVIPSMTIEGITYPNVIHSVAQERSYYWAKGIGLIKSQSGFEASAKTATLVRMQ